MCSSASCDGCAYAHFSSFFHTGPRKECVRRYFVRLLPWKISRRVTDKLMNRLTEKGGTPSGQRKEVWHAQHGCALTAAH